MMNFVRADLYRLRKSGTILGIVFFFFAFLFMRYLLEWVLAKGMFGLSATGTTVIARSFIDYLAIGSTSGLLLVPSTWFAVWLIASDYKSHTFKSLLTTTSARWNYVIAKFVVSVILTAVTIALMIAWSALIPFAFGLEFEMVPTIQQIVGWGVMAFLVSLMYCGISIFFALLVGNETIAWFCNMLFVLGIAGAVAMFAANLISAYLPGTAEVVRALSEWLPVAQCSFLDLGLDVFQQNTDYIQHLVIVCLTWAIVTTIASLVIFRRRAL